MVKAHEVIAQGVAENAFDPSFTADDIVFVFKALVGQSAGDVLTTGKQVDPMTEAERLMRMLWLGVGRNRDGQ